MKQLIYIAACAALLASCTKNERARSFGGTTQVDLPKDCKFVTATWKDTDLWYAYRPARQGELPETVVLQEQSSFGMMEGTVKFQEH